MNDIYFDPNDLHQTVDEADDNEETWILGNPFAIEVDDGAVPVVTKRYENGCFCTQCGELYPQAEPNQPDGTLICYSCRRFMKK